MTRRVSVVDLGLGNLRSVVRAIERAGGEATLVSGADEVARAERIVVPGQGAFRDFARALAHGVGDALVTALGRGTPYLGICLGMQLLFDESEEAEGERGLGLFRGRVRRFSDALVDPETGERLKVPHMGWNLVRGSHPFLEPEAYFYFVHSYHCAPEDPSIVVGVADYGGEICAAVARGNVFACQFHPEKSDEAGRMLLEKFLAS
jgi:glutamine amidotransferase